MFLGLSLLQVLFKYLVTYVGVVSSYFSLWVLVGDLLFWTFDVDFFGEKCLRSIKCLSFLLSNILIYSYKKITCFCDVMMFFFWEFVVFFPFLHGKLLVIKSHLYAFFLDLLFCVGMVVLF